MTTPEPPGSSIIPIIWVVFFTLFWFAWTLGFSSYLLARITVDLLTPKDTR